MNPPIAAIEVHEIKLTIDIIDPPPNKSQAVFKPKLTAFERRDTFC